MKLWHECRWPHIENPVGVEYVETKWRCPVCGERWLVGSWYTSWTAKRCRGINLKHLLWSRKQRKLVA